MDIIITLPDKEKEGIKSLIKHYYQSKDDKETIYYRVSNLPVNAKIGDKCYIISNGEIIGYHIIFKLCRISKEEASELSGGSWREGFYIIRKADTFKELKEKIKARGFQGYRYFHKFMERKTD